MEERRHNSYHGRATPSKYFGDRAVLKDRNTGFSETFRITTEARRICRYWINKNWFFLHQKSGLLVPTGLAVPPDEEKKGFAVLNLRNKVQQGFSMLTETGSSSLQVQIAQKMSSNIALRWTMRVKPLFRLLWMGFGGMSAFTGIITQAPIEVY